MDMLFSDLERAMDLYRQDRPDNKGGDRQEASTESLEKMKASFAGVRRGTSMLRLFPSREFTV